MGHERRGRAGLQTGVQGPVLFGHKGHDGALPVAHQPQGHGLHPAGAQARFDLLPQEGADLVAHQAIQDAPGLLGIVAGPVELHGCGQGRLDGLGSQLQEQHPVEAVVFLPQNLGDVPGDGLAFPVRVRPQIDLRDVRGDFLQLLDDFGLSQDGDVFGGKIVFQVHPQLVFRQVLDVSFAGDHLDVGAQVFLQGLGLGGRFYDEQ